MVDRCRVTVLVVVISSIPAMSQVVVTKPPTTTGNANRKEWSFSASATSYFVPDRHDYVQPTFTADHGQLHLQMRYNYENLETGSAWIGYNFEAGR